MNHDLSFTLQKHYSTYNPMSAFVIKSQKKDAARGSSTSDQARVIVRSRLRVAYTTFELVLPAGTYGSLSVLVPVDYRRQLVPMMYYDDTYGVLHHRCL